MSLPNERRGHFLKLVFNDYRGCRLLLRNEVNVEVAARLLALRFGERKVEGVVQNLDVVLKPLVRSSCLMLPNFSQRHALNFPIIRLESFPACLQAICRRRSHDFGSQVEQERLRYAVALWSAAK